MVFHKEQCIIRIIATDGPKLIMYCHFCLYLSNISLSEEDPTGKADMYRNSRLWLEMDGYNGFM